MRLASSAIATQSSIAVPFETFATAAATSASCVARRASISPFFCAFACAVTRAIADYSRPIRLPVHMSDCVNSIKRARGIFYMSNGRSPTEVELASALGISEAKLRLALASSRELVSLEAPYYQNK